ncbi:MAG: flagellar export protein FliJ [Roseateles depolymerans]|uniref:Flagellar FliJ protein n=1 Tax=Roseateles depolymerans TaxID=76731 RepID=A0A2W5E1W1_9BURK|nr:MAG: flagellar export protein FliJ [Roseateles depolymerans]
MSAQPDALQLLLERAEEARDAAAQALHAAHAQAHAAHVQHGELSGYRVEYERRWLEQFSQPTTMGLVGCFQSFGQRLEQAVSSQGQAAQFADHRERHAREQLRQAEMRVAALRQLIARRRAEAQLAEQRREQRSTDEYAARAHLRRHSTHHPV